MLVLSVALFAAIWAGDRPQRHTSPGDGQQSADAATAGSPVVADECLVRLDVPLPAALAPGEYVIVGDSGTVRSARFMAEDLIYLGVSVANRPAEVTAVSDGARRWYFIRVEGSPDERVLMLPDGPFCWGTKWLVWRAFRGGELDVRLLTSRTEAYCAAAMAQWRAFGRTALESARPFVEGIANRWGQMNPPTRLSGENRNEPRL
jgi:hypothetical protein